MSPSATTLVVASGKQNAQKSRSANGSGVKAHLSSVDVIQQEHEYGAHKWVEPWLLNDRQLSGFRY